MTTGAAAVESPATGAAGVEHLSVSVMAHLLGVTASSLGTWHRRYGVGPSEHAVGRHRRYAPTDVARLEVMNQALLGGAGPAEAARIALQTPLAPYVATSGAQGAGPEAPEAVDGLAELVAVGVRQPGAGSATSAGWRAHCRADGGWVAGGGGVLPGETTLRMAGLGRDARGLARVVEALDATAVQHLIGEAVAAGGVVWAWDQVVRPVMGAVSQLWEGTDTGVEMEHLLSECVTSVMAKVQIDAPPPVSPRAVLLAAVPGEQHTLPLRVLAAVLARRRVRTTLLGGDLPIVSLVAAVARTKPSAVLLWSQIDANADPALLEVLPRLRTGAKVFVGGTAWPPLPPLVVALDGLEEADATLTAAASSAR